MPEKSLLKLLKPSFWDLQNNLIMKWNWGTKIIISFVLFGAFILYMVVQAFMMDFDLVSENYYQDELAFQDRIDEKANLLKSGDQVAINQSGEKVVFAFPDTFKGAEGMIYFYPETSIQDPASCPLGGR